jgi:agmatine deiminase
MVTERGESPRTAGYTQPAEWAPHERCYTAWPAHEYAWGEHLRAAQREVVEFARVFSQGPTPSQCSAQEPLHVLVDDAHRAEAQAALGALAPGVVLCPEPYGDVWLRDTAPVFVRGPAGVASVRFQFNGWGEKYVYPHDAQLAERLARRQGGREFVCDFVLEGGAVDVDGQGTGLTTRSCLHNPNRNPPADLGQIDARLYDALGVRRWIWLDRGLLHDHTDGHIDNIARFVAPGVVVCMQSGDDDDPNRDTLDAIASDLERERDARGVPLRVVRIPSPGRVLGADGRVAPASHMNFYIGNARVILPIFGTRWDEPARAALQALFPDRDVVTSPARALLEGGGTFHCMTQQVPAP